MEEKTKIQHHFLLEQCRSVPAPRLAMLQERTQFAPSLFAWRSIQKLRYRPHRARTRSRTWLRRWTPSPLARGLQRACVWYGARSNAAWTKGKIGPEIASSVVQECAPHSLAVLDVSENKVWRWNGRGQAKQVHPADEEESTWTERHRHSGFCDQQRTSVRNRCYCLKRLACSTLLFSSRKMWGGFLYCGVLLLHTYPPLKTQRSLRLHTHSLQSELSFCSFLVSVKLWWFSIISRVRQDVQWDIILFIAHTVHRGE